MSTVRFGRVIRSTAAYGVPQACATARLPGVGLASAEVEDIATLVNWRFGGHLVRHLA